MGVAPTKSSRARLGARGEDLAAALLQNNAYTILARNYHCRYGEIDLICLQQDVLVFCEVKLRRTASFGMPEEAMTPRKLARITRSAQTYLSAHGREDADWRIDVVAIELNRQGSVMRTALYQGAGS